MSADLQNPIFNDETAAREALEAVRWPRGPTCPHCGNADQEKIAKVEGKKQSHRPGLHYCNECKGQFTATVGTVFESSKVPLTKWWLASHLMGSSKKGMSAHQMHRMLGVTYKTAWFMAHRIREAMRDDFGPANPLGGKGKTVEIDETYHGNVKVPRPRNKYLPPPTKGGKVGPAGKRAVLALVERQGKRSGRNRGVYPTVRTNTRCARTDRPRKGADRDSAKATCRQNPRAGSGRSKRYARSRNLDC